MYRNVLDLIKMVMIKCHKINSIPHIKSAFQHTWLSVSLIPKRILISAHWNTDLLLALLNHTKASSLLNSFKDLVRRLHGLKLKFIDLLIGALSYEKKTDFYSYPSCFFFFFSLQNHSAFITWTLWRESIARICSWSEKVNLPYWLLGFEILRPWRTWLLPLYCLVSG